MASDGDRLLDAARRWVDEDPDPETRDELAQLIAARDRDELAERFGARLEFGTAGLRGALGAGPNRMNVAVVRRAAAGVAASLPPGDAPVVVGWDARHKSEVFAQETAAVLAGAGRRAMMLPGPSPTPLLAFAVRHLRAAAGVMVTASHNPANDNGYKVFWSDGAQIVPPVDTAISAAIDAIANLGDVPLAPTGSPLVSTASAELTDAYAAGAAALIAPDTARSISVVYTPIHGVARDLVLRLFTDAGFPTPHVVAAQSEPDPAFPTAPFPNPEEPGVLDLAIRDATRLGADVVLANDPDGDRLAVAAPDGSGSWRVLHGDEIGVLLARHLIDAGRIGPGDLLATTVVSSRLLSVLAAEAGAAFAETLTGFKWVARAADGTGKRFGFGYEEALGYCVGQLVRDKDGLGAALVMAEAVASLAAAGRTVDDALAETAARHGLHHSEARSVRVEGLDGQARMQRAMAGLRAAPPAEIGGIAVERVEDLLAGSDLPPADVVRLFLADGTRLVARPSGTEPKLKVYAEVVEALGDRPLAAARATASARAGGLADELTAALGLT